MQSGREVFISQNIPSADKVTYGILSTEGNNKSRKG